MSEDLNSKLLEIKDLTVEVRGSLQQKEIVSHVDLSLAKETITGLVGGSGSGKTTLGLSILNLLSEGLKIKSGSIYLNGSDILKFSQSQMRTVRGGRIGMVFQEPLYAFNPLYTIDYQIREVLIFHSDLPRNKHKARVLELLDLVGIDDPQRVAFNYPHQLSGGMRQRAMIAQAIAADPALIIADEPTSNLDVTLQARIIDLFRKLKKDLKLSILLITHDLGLVEHLTDEVYVMKAGGIVESGKTSLVLKAPRENYTKELLSVIRE